MMNKACLALIVAMCPATLFAGETMVTRTKTVTTTQCNFRVDKCATSVANDPDYFHFKDGAIIGGSTTVTSQGGVPVPYRETFVFADFAPQPPTLDDLLAIIRSNLSNCPEVTVSYDEDTGDITVHYLHGDCNDCDWVVNVRNVKADDFVWTRTSDNYSPYLGQMERRKFHCNSDQNVQKIESACAQICRMNSWSMYK